MYVKSNITLFCLESCCSSCIVYGFC